MKNLLSLGWISSITFILGTFFLGSLLTDYNLVSQTISEIGEKGSPLYVQWQIFSLTIGVLLMVFSIGIILFARGNMLSYLPGIFVLFAGLSEFGIAFFPSPHPLHNVFGLTMIIGYFSPLMFFLLWKDKLGLPFKRFSLIAFILIILGIFLNLTPAFAPSLYPLEYYGLVQRFLIFTFYIYIAYVALNIIRSSKISTRPTEHTKI